MSDKSLIEGGFALWLSAHRERNRDCFALYRRFDALCHKVRAQLSWDDHSRQQLFVNALYHRSISLFEAVYVLAENGLIAESRILSRSLLELTFALVAASKHKTFAEQYVSEKDVSERKLRSQALPHLSVSLAAEKLGTLEEQLRELELFTKGIKRTPIERVAELAGLHDRYETDYRALSRSTHIGIHDLDQYLVLDRQRRVMGFQFGPSDDCFAFSMSMPMHTMLLVLESVCRYHCIDVADKRALLAAELLRLGKSDGRRRAED